MSTWHRESALSQCGLPLLPPWHLSVALAKPREVLEHQPKEDGLSGRAGEMPGRPEERGPAVDRLRPSVFPRLS